MSLFPSVRLPEENNSSSNISVTFPANETTKSDHAANEKLEWLSNKSFVPTVAEIIHKNYSYDDQIYSEAVPDEGVKDLSEPSPKRHRQDEGQKEVAKKKRKKKEQKVHHHKRDKAKAIEERSLKNCGQKVFIDDAQTQREDAFYVDRCGDGSNKGFSSMYHLFVAKYVRCEKLPLGLENRHRVEWLKNTPRKLRRSNRYYSQKNFKLLYTESDSIFASKIPNVTDQYIPLELSTQKFSSVDKSLNFNSLGIYDASTALYVEGKGLPSSAEILSETSLPSVISKKIASFNQLLREDPGNVASWLQFVHFQSEVMEAEAFSVSTVDRRQINLSSKIVTEKKISILEKAMSLNPKSVELAIEHLKLCEEVWPNDKVSSKWKQLGFYHPHSVMYWKNYLTYAQSNLKTFSVSSVGKNFARCMSTLKKFSQGTFQSHKAPDDLETFVIEIFMRTLYFYKQSGYTERAISTLQAMLEFTFFQPEVVESSSFKQKLDCFELFWENGSPRIGETNAPGWKNMHENTPVNLSDVLDLDTLEDAVIAKNLPLSKTWLEFESLRERENWLPWRPNKDKGLTYDDCEDADRLALFDDIVPMIFVPASDAARFILVLQCLIFLEIDVLPHTSSFCKKLSCHTQTLLCSVNSFSPFKFFQFAFGKTASNIPEIADLDDSIWTSARQDVFVNNLFENLIPCFSEPYITDLKLLWCAWKVRQIYRSDGSLKSKTQLKIVRKDLKNFLQVLENRTKTELWVSFALFEAECGNFAEAEKIFQFILSSSNDPSSPAAVHGFYMYCQIILGSSNVSTIPKEQKIQPVLIGCSLGEKLDAPNKVSRPSPNLVLKAKRAFSNRLCDLLETQTVISLVQDCFLSDWLGCYALFLYTTNGIESSAQVYEDVITKIQKENSDKLILEQIYTNYLRLMLHHVNTTVSPLSKIRRVLTEAMEIFPDNQHFLQLFVDLEARSFISGRQRRFFSHVLKANKDVSPITWCFAVHSELLRLESLSTNFGDSNENSLYDGGSTWWIKSLFEKACQIQSLQHCVYLWRLYLKFQIEQQDYEKAKSVFYRAVQKCAWAKSLYIDACKYFPEDIQQFHDLMVEKEIRIRAPLDEISLLQRAKPSCDTD